MYVPFILARSAQLLLTDRSLLPAPMNTYQAPLLFMARMKNTCQSRSLLCVSSLIVSFFTVVELCVLAQPPTPNLPFQVATEVLAAFNTWTSVFMVFGDRSDHWTVCSGSTGLREQVASELLQVSLIKLRLFSFFFSCFTSASVHLAPYPSMCGGVYDKSGWQDL